MRKLTLWVIATGFAIINAAPALAQAPATPPPVWTGNFGGGLAWTSGNSDTKNFNVSFALVRDPKTKNVIKLNALYLRGDKESETIIDRTTFLLRDEYTVSGRVFVFGQLDHLRDKFKDIIYLWSPSVGIGYKLWNTDAGTLTVDNGLGGIWERNPGRSRRGSGAYNAAERLNWKLSKTSAINQSVSGLWKTNDWADALYNLTLGLSASVTQNSELKFEVNDLYKNRPASVTIKKNDVAFITAFVLKF
jgi:putative salt-induced outer membrane protein YdiY